jgi:hypothetical protein
MAHPFPAPKEPDVARQKPEQNWYMIADFPDQGTRIYIGGIERSHMTDLRDVFVATLKEIEPHDHPCDLLLEQSKPITVQRDGDFTIPITVREYQSNPEYPRAHKMDTHSVGMPVKPVVGLWIAARFDMIITSGHGPFRVQDMRGHDRIYGTPLTPAVTECDRQHNE